MCTLEKRGRVYLLTLTGDGEHRLNAPLLDSVHAALARVRAEAGGGGAALVTAAEGKFFSNGFDLAWARASPGDRPRLMGTAFARVAAALASLPVPTVAAVTGHAAAAGFFLVLAHDYVVMRGDRGFLYFSEVDLGIPIVDHVMALARAKIAPRARRDAVLLGAKLTAAQAKEKGVVDVVCGSAGQTVEAALRLGEELAAKKWDGGVYAAARVAVFPELSKIVEEAALRSKL